MASDSKSLHAFRLDLMKAVQEKFNAKVLALCPRDSHFENISEQLQAQGIELRPIDLKNTGLNPFQDFGYFLKLVNILKAEKPHAVFTMTIKPVIYGLLAAAVARVPKRFGIITGLGHLYTFNDFKTRVLRFFVNCLYRLAFSNATQVFFQNPDDAQWFLNLGLLSPDRAQITYGSGVNLDRYPLTPLPILPPVTFLFVGRLLKAKGIGEFCEAVQGLKGAGHQLSKARFQVLGGFHPNPSAFNQQELMERMGLAGIEYVGEHPTSLDYIQNAHVVVLPSYREGTPRALLEALAVGRPIITTDVPGCRETVIEGLNGYLVNPHSAPSLQEAFEKVLQHPQRLEGMAQESHKLARERFDVQKVNAFILSFL